MNDRLENTQDLLLNSYNYQLPDELIAQNPASPRDSSRLLVVNSLTSYVNSSFRELTEWLLPGDLLVLNDTRVIPARLYGHSSSGSSIEILLLEEQQPNIWSALVKPGKRFKLGTELIFRPPQGPNNVQSEILRARVIAKDTATGGRILEFEVSQKQSFWQLLDRFGVLPLPPYITATNSELDRYQTVFAQKPGAVAAPTAGLHFTSDLLDRLLELGVRQTYITLHVGVGTFRPVETSAIEQHVMHREWIEVGEATVEQIKETKAKGGRVIAIGTTATRALEGAWQASLDLQPFRGNTNLFIYPGYRWQVVDGLITNFHLPSSSLLMLVSALIGRQRLMDLYQEAISNNYRFYSFGDAMLILPEATINN